MEEENNNNNDNNGIDTNEIFKETSNTFNEVKDQVKESFKKEELKNSAKETKNFIIGMFKNPIEELKAIANDSTNSNFKYAVILIVVWMVAELLYQIIVSAQISRSFGRAIGLTIKNVIVPIITIFVLSLIVMIMNKKKDKSLITIISVVTASYLPIVIANIVYLLRLISSEVTKITNPFGSLCAIIKTILLYFGIKFLLKEEDDNRFIKKFVIIEAIYYLAAIALSFFEISI